jgi:hypothetical protein
MRRSSVSSRSDTRSRTWTDWILHRGEARSAPAVGRRAIAQAAGGRRREAIVRTHWTFASSLRSGAGEADAGHWETESDACELCARHVAGLPEFMDGDELIRRVRVRVKLVVERRSNDSGRAALALDTPPSSAGQSDDSRFWGPVPASWIVGVVNAGK